MKREGESCRLGLNTKEKGGSVRNQSPAFIDSQIILLKGASSSTVSHDKAISLRFIMSFSFHVFNGKRPTGVFVLQR